MTATVLVTDGGFVPADPAEDHIAPEALPDSRGAVRLDLPPDADLDALAPHLGRVVAVRIAFPVFSDGRGFTLARSLRRMGFRGRLRAAGHLIADQYPLARACGFDDVEISAELARRQPEADWLKDLGRPGYMARLRA